VGPGFDGHGAGSTLRGDRLNHLELAGRCLPYYGESAVSIGAERQTRPWIKAVSIDTLADRNEGDHVARIRRPDFFPVAAFIPLQFSPGNPAAIAVTNVSPGAAIGGSFLDVLQHPVVSLNCSRGTP